MTLDELTKAIAGARERLNAFAWIGTIDELQFASDVKQLLAVIDQLLPDARRMEWVITDLICHGRIRHSDLPITDTSAAGIRPAIDRAIEGEKK